MFGCICMVALYLPFSLYLLMKAICRWKRTQSTRAGSPNWSRLGRDEKYCTLLLTELTGHHTRVISQYFTYIHCLFFERIQCLSTLLRGTGYYRITACSFLRWDHPVGVAAIVTEPCSTPIHASCMLNTRILTRPEKECNYGICVGQSISSLSSS